MVRLAVAVIAWSGVLLQLPLSIRMAQSNGGDWVDGLIAYFGYFTVLTNLLVALVLTAPMIAPRSRFGRFFADASVAGCAAVSIAVVGVVYHGVLSSLWSPQGAQWLADQLLHSVTPIVYLLHWIVGDARRRLSWSAPLHWTLYPVGFLVYALLRGLWLGTYPYPFIDAGELGYGRVLMNSLAIAAAFLILGYGVVLLSRWRSGNITS